MKWDYRWSSCRYLRDSHRSEYVWVKARRRTVHDSKRLWQPSAPTLQCKILWMYSSVCSLHKGYLLQSSVVVLILSSIQNFCKSKNVSFCSKPMSSDLKSVILLVNTRSTSTVADEPLFRSGEKMHLLIKLFGTMSADTQAFSRHKHMRRRQVKYVRPHDTAFGDLIDETNTFQHICNVIDMSSLFYGQDPDSLKNQKWIWLQERDTILYYIKMKLEMLFLTTECGWKVAFSGKGIYTFKINWNF